MTVIFFFFTRNFFWFFFISQRDWFDIEILRARDNFSTNFFSKKNWPGNDVQFNVKLTTTERQGRRCIHRVADGWSGGRSRYRWRGRCVCGGRGHTGTWSRISFRRIVWGHRCFGPEPSGGVCKLAELSTDQQLPSPRPIDVRIPPARPADMISLHRDSATPSLSFLARTT